MIRNPLCTRFTTATLVAAMQWVRPGGRAGVSLDDASNYRPDGLLDPVRLTRLIWGLILETRLRSGRSAC